MNNEARKKERQEKAEKVQSAWSKLSPQQQLDELDRRLGKGVGAVKQRAKIAEKIKKKKVDKKK